jgi:hypothetical protein
LGEGKELGFGQFQPALDSLQTVLNARALPIDSQQVALKIMHLLAQGDELLVVIVYATLDMCNVSLNLFQDFVQEFVAHGFGHCGLQLVASP